LRNDGFLKASVRIYEDVKQMIINWELKPNDQLVEHVLAERFAASRTPIREALQRLAQDGFVRMLPRRGARVSRLLINDIREIFQIREALEGMAARIAATNLSDIDLKHMMSYILKCQKNPERDEGARVHDIIEKGCKNDRLITMISTYRDQINRIHHLVARLPNRSKRSAKEHLAICQVIQKRDAEAAEIEMRKHIANLRVELTDMLLNLKWDNI
jgi:DNA-binding GntR family transcriptional regulator